MSDFPKELCFALTDRLNDDDNAKQTYGCRHTNPDICGSSYINNVCAFASEDKICKKIETFYSSISKTLSEAITWS